MTRPQRTKPESTQTASTQIEQTHIAPSCDVDALIVPHREAIKIAYAGLFSTPFPSDDTLRDEWRAILGTPQATAYLAEYHQTPVGTVAATVDNQHAAWLEKLYVHPDYQSLGIGKALHERVLEDLTVLGFQEVNLWVLAANTSAIDRYLTWGWRRVPSPPYAPFGLPQWRYARPLR